MILELAVACAMSGPNQQMVERILTEWTHIERDLLALPPVPPPQIILVDRRCQYTLSPESGGSLRLRGVRLGLSAREHGDTIRLPNGVQIPLAGLAFTSLRGDGQPFFIATLPDVWAADPKYRDDDEDWARFLPPVLIHELAHTRQLGAIIKALMPELTGLKLEAVDDDIVQRRYESDSTFTAGVLHERDLLFASAHARDRCTRLALIGEALDARAARHARYFTGADSAYGPIETRFLDLEGLGQWAALQFLLRNRSPSETRGVLIERVRDNQKWWSQELGLALYLALDAVAPNALRQTFPPELLSGFEGLHLALASSAGQSAAICRRQAGR